MTIPTFRATNSTAFSSRNHLSISGHYPADIRLVRGPGDAAEVIAVDQVRIAIGGSLPGSRSEALGASKAAEATISLQ